MLTHRNRITSYNVCYTKLLRIEDYIVEGGYKAVAKALFEMTPESVLAEVKTANLRGRGGAGFPAAIKWELCRNEQSDQRYIICNADEGDPGAFHRITSYNVCYTKLLRPVSARNVTVK